MKLADWMKANDLRDEDLAAKLGIDRSTCSRWRREKNAPTRSVMARIVDLTDGAVQPNSFFGMPGAPRRRQRKEADACPAA